MRCREVMEGVTCLSPGSTVGDARAAIERHRVRLVALFERPPGGVGVVSRDDLEGSPARSPLRALMRPVTSCPASLRVCDAVRRFARHGVPGPPERYLLCFDAEAPVGALRPDLLRSYADHLTQGWPLLHVTAVRPLIPES